MNECNTIHVIKPNKYLLRAINSIETIIFSVSPISKLSLTFSQ